MSAKLTRWGLILIVLLSLAPGLPGGRSAAAQAAQPAPLPEAEVICTLPLGEDGVNYRGENLPDMLTTGPSALQMAPGGDFWVADSAANRLVRFSADCQRQQVVNLPDSVVFITDFEPGAQGLWVLDASAQQPQVVRLDFDGQAAARYELPVDEQPGLTGLVVNESGQLLVEKEGGASLLSFMDETEAPVAPSAALAPLFASDPLPLSDLAGVRPLGSGPGGERFVVRDEVRLSGPTIRVDRTVGRYTAAGELTGEARVPIGEQYTVTSNGLALDDQGSVFFLLTQKDGASLLRLNFMAHLEPILPGESQAAAEAAVEADQPQPEVGAYDLPTTSPSAIMARARAYLNNRKYYNATNTDGACSGRGKPRYMGGAGWYSSVPYDWGGTDSIAQFNSYMDPGTYKAGDINTAASESCSKGVDCAGFVQRAWGLPGPETPGWIDYNATTLQNISQPLSSTGLLQRGDILVWPGNHVMLFSSFAANGVYVFEATTYNSVDRVVYNLRTWDSINSNYRPRRYNAVTAESCAGQYRAEYFNNRSEALASTPVLERCETWPISYNWGSGSPGSGVNSDNFMARWVGRASFNAANYTFIVRADDGVRVWLDGVIILNKWIDQGPTEYRVTRAVTAGMHNIQVDYYENGGGALIEFRWQQDNPGCPTITAWKGEYFNNQTLSGTPLLCRDDAQVRFYWGAGGPGGGIPNDHFSARFTRAQAFSAARYRFHLKGDDGIRLWVDNQVRIDRWIDQGATEYTADLDLSAGSHDLKVEYYENGGDAVVDLWWEQLSGGGPAGYAFCANEGQRCSFSDLRDVAYGANGRFNYRTNVSGGIDCTNAVFGDPIPGVFKACYSRAASASGNLALNRTAYATSSESATYLPARANDGNTGTRWSSRISTTLGDEWWWVDLGSTQTFDRVVIRWETAYAAQHFVGWSNDCSSFTGYWYTISAPGTYSYTLGSRSARCAAVLMRTRAPNMNNYSFYEYEVYRSAGLMYTSGLNLTPGDSGEMILPALPPESNQLYLPWLNNR